MTVPAGLSSGPDASMAPVMRCTMLESLSVSLSHANMALRPSLPGGAERPSDHYRESQDGASSHLPRRMIAVTVALSEPADAEPLDWPATLASFLRLEFAGTTVQIIDTWRVDQ